MCSPMSAKATISSRLAAISSGPRPEQRRGEIDVGEPGVLRMEARAQLEQRADAAVDLHRAARRRDHARDDLQQRRLARAVLADDAERLAALQREAHVVERAEDVRGAVAAQQVAHEAQLPAARLDLRVVLADVVERQQALPRPCADGCHQTKSSKCGDSRRNTQRPAKNSATRRRPAHRVAPLERQAAVEQRLAQPPHEPAERIGGDPGAHRFGHERQRIQDRRQVHEDHQHRHQHVLDVAHEHLQRREEQRDADDADGQHAPTAERRAASPSRCIGSPYTTSATSTAT